LVSGFFLVVDRLLSLLGGCRIPMVPGLIATIFAI